MRGAALGQFVTFTLIAPVFFAARFGFRIADETMALMKSMVDTGEADHLVPERVWQEFSRGLGEDRPGLMFEAPMAGGVLGRPEASPRWRP